MFEGRRVPGRRVDVAVPELSTGLLTALVIAALLAGEVTRFQLTE